MPLAMYANGKYALHINEDWCKGCGICVAFCPKGLVKLIEEKPLISNPSLCGGCGNCQIYCPDFAIQVNKI